MNMKLFISFIAIVIFQKGVDGARFAVNDCVLMDMDGTVTVDAVRDDQTEVSVQLDLSKAAFSVSGNCSKMDTSVSMVVHLESDSLLDWSLVFMTRGDHVEMDQLIRFAPSVFFKNNTLPSDMVFLANVGSTLSRMNESFLCKSDRSIPFSSAEADNYTFTVSQVIRNLQVQAFNLENNTFSPAEECWADQKTTGPTTEPVTVEPVPAPSPVEAVIFIVRNGEDLPCFLLEAGLQLLVEYKTTKDEMVLSKPIVLPASANVTGICASGTSTPATIIIRTKDIALQIVETASGGEAFSAISLNITLDADNFPDAALVGQTVSFKMATSSFHQTNVTTFYECNAQQSLEFANTRTTLFANSVRLQAFGLDDGNFTGDGVECGLDPTTSPQTPVTTTPTPDENTYVVRNAHGNVSCIVMVADIIFTNIPYNLTNGNETIADSIPIPRMNKTTRDVKVSGSCDLENGNAQRLVITFNKDWSLSLTFALIPDQASLTTLGATEGEYSLRDIEFKYFLTPEFFPNASRPNIPQTAQLQNISTDFMRGEANGGSFKCRSELTRSLDNGAQMDTTNLQYKAFNSDNSTDFSDDVAECYADLDDDSLYIEILGIIIAAVVAIVIVGCLIFKTMQYRHRRVGYQEI